MDKKIDIDLIMNDNPFDFVPNIVNKITENVAETQDEFIFTTISDWWMHNTQRHISKQDLIEALTKHKPKSPIVMDLYLVCGSCEKDILRRYNYCPYCGQKVDWE